MKSSVLVFGDSITFPYGATTGERIEVDGVQGEIRFYDSSNNLVLTLNGSSIISARFDGPGVILTAAEVGDASARFGISSSGALVWGDGVSLLPDTALTRSGADILAASGTFRAAEDIQVGTALFSLPRGMMDRAEEPNNVALSTTAGTYTTIVEGNLFIWAETGRKYKLSFFGGNNLLINGTGQATGDIWQCRFQVSVNGGAYANVSASRYLARLQNAINTRVPVFTYTDEYTALSGNSLQFRFQASKTTGAVTVTSSMDTVAGSPWVLLVEDIGAV